MVGATNIAVMRVRVSFLVLAASATCFAACGGSSASSSAPPAGGPAAATVEVKNFSFQPNTVTVPRGATVEWRFDDGAIPHNVAGSGLTSGDHYSGSYRHTFDQSGTFSYQCTLHTYMKGSVVVP